MFEVRRGSHKAEAVSAGLEQGWLAFVSGHQKRRLAPFPPDWAAASPTELERLCGRARAAKSTFAAGPVAAGSASAPPPESAPPESTPTVSEVSVAGGQSPVETTVRGFAHEARTQGLPAIEAMVRLKALLAAEHPASDSDARDLRRVRRWFVESYYFERER